MQKVTLEIPDNSGHLFTTLLQAGVQLRTVSTCSIGEFLLTLKGFSYEYLCNEVETIFLNGTPVDDLDQHFSGDSPTLALSAAMPGLAGAIFRKNSIHSALRTNPIKEQAESDKAEQLTVTLKLFNTVAKDKGSLLLQAGVILPGDKLVSFLNRQSFLWDLPLVAKVDGKILNKKQFLKHFESNTLINLVIDNYD